MPAARRRLGGFAIAEIAVRICGAEATGGFHVAEALKDGCGVVADIFEQIAAVIRQAARWQSKSRSVSWRVTQASYISKSGAKIVNAAIPVDGTFANESGQDSGSDWLGDRGDFKDGVGIDRLFLVDFAEAEAFEIDHFVVVDDANGDTRHARALERSLSKLFELRNGGIDFFASERARGSGGWRGLIGARGSFESRRRRMLCNSEQYRAMIDVHDLKLPILVQLAVAMA